MKNWMKVLGSMAVMALTFSLGCGTETETQIAVVLPETGAWADYGTEIRRGIEVALDEVAAETGTAPMTVSWLDSESNAENAARLLDQAFEAGAFAAIGGVTSSEALAMIPATQKHSRVLLSPSASSLELSDAGRYFMRIFPTDFDEGSRMGRFAVEELKLEGVTLLVPESIYGGSVQNCFRDAFESNGGVVAGVIEYGDTPDYAALADQALEGRPQGIYLADYAGGVGRLIDSLRGAGYKGAILTTSAFSPVLGGLASDATAIYLTRTSYDAASTDPVVETFAEAYRAKFGSEPGYFAAHGYDSMKVMITSLQTGGGAEDLPNNLWRHLRGLQEYQGVTGTIQFNEKGDVQKYPQIYLVDEGELKSHSEYVEEIRQRREELMRRLEANRRRQAAMADDG